MVCLTRVLSCRGVGEWKISSFEQSNCCKVILPCEGRCKFLEAARPMVLRRGKVWCGPEFAPNADVNVYLSVDYWNRLGSKEAKRTVELGGLGWQLLD